MTLTATEQKLQNIAQMDASKQFIDANANVKGRCFFGWILTVLRLNHVSFIRNYMNACCDANLTQTAAKVKDLINDSIKETSVKSEDDKTALYTSVLAKINPILDKAKVAKIDLNDILNPKKDDQPAPAPVPPPTDLQVSYAPPEAAGDKVEPEAPAAADAPQAPVVAEEPSVLSAAESAADDAKIVYNYTLEPLNANRQTRLPTDRAVQKFLREAAAGRHTLQSDDTYHYKNQKIIVKPQPQADATS